MSLYGFDAVHREQQEGARTKPSLYSSLSSREKPGSKLFDLSMDDLDDSDLENLNFTKINSQHMDISQPTTVNHLSREKDTPGFQLSFSSNAGNSDKQNKLPASSHSFESAGSRPSLVSGTRLSERIGRHAGYQQTEMPGSGHEQSSQEMIPSDDEHPISPRLAPSTGPSKAREYRDADRHRTPASYRLSQTDSDVTEEPNAVHGASDLARNNVAAASVASATETPAYKLPPHPKTQGSNVTTRWRRRGRLGLAKPKRVAADGRSDPNANDGEGDGLGTGIESSPPNSLDFLAGSSGSIDQKHGGVHISRSPPRSFASGYGSIESIDSANHHGSIASLDDIAAADVEHTFQASRVRISGRSGTGAMNGSQETIRSAANGGTAASYESSANGRYMDISDISTTSNPKSRPQSPEPPAGTSKMPVDVDSSPPNASQEASSATHSKGRASVPSSNESRGLYRSESARRRAMSPLPGRARPLTSTQTPGSNSSENNHQRGASPRASNSLSGYQSNNSANDSRRRPSQGDSAMDISARFQQYERRMNDMSPQYRSPRERPRVLASMPQSPEKSPVLRSMSVREERKDSRASENRDARQLQGSSRSLRNTELRSPPEKQQRHQSPEDRPGYFNVEFASPRLSARRAPDNNFDALRNNTPMAPQDTARAEASSGSGSKAPSMRSNSRSKYSPFPMPVVENKAPVQEPSPIPVTAQVTEQRIPQEQPLPASTSQSQQQHSAPRNSMDPKRTLAVNGRPYQKISITGRGGSSKVYKAMSAKHEIFAIKRVSFSRADVQAIEGYVNEIILLRKFEGNPYIIQLFDAEINKERGLLHMVMEFGETDLASVLKRSGSRPLGMNVIRLYWEQMLRAVQTIHEERVVHADLKPANYLLVKGSLKLIDFGIAKAIGNDTTNIHRENQIGTVNYMSPEAIKETNTDGGKRMMKLGRASDIWSLGIILYQMCYGRTPFAQLPLFKKLASIPDPSFVIPYPPYMAGCLQVGTEKDPNADTEPRFPDGTEKIQAPPELLRVMRICLQRDPIKRMSIPDLLVDPLLCPISLDQALPSAMSQMLSLLKRTPHVLDQWDVSEAQNERVLSSLVHALHQQEQSR
ncbi:Serine/threonine kinase mps1 [Coemansia guatemalensis]|uniref:Serine/threonine kinase mps1 n=1 Tax=Coemansia guatemalensis TaxID=2761395 RepID=A0A9W8HWY3_9FUNG|nr:Serine/threonine kinase mps1 [Coemansia guatemalensis]